LTNPDLFFFPLSYVYQTEKNSALLLSGFGTGSIEPARNAAQRIESDVVSPTGAIRTSKGPSFENGFPTNGSKVSAKNWR
jgi:hypothetical protein